MIPHFLHALATGNIVAIIIALNGIIVGFGTAAAMLACRTRKKVAE